MEAIDDLVFSTALFVLGHFLLSSTVVRNAITSKIGVKPFLGLYSLFALVTFIWMILAYQESFYQPVWEPPLSLRYVTLLLMYPASILLFCSLTTKSPTRVGGDEMLKDENPNSHEPTGIITITRHPMLISAVLWSLSHLLVNGDRSTIIIGVGILILAIGGMLHIDQRRALVGGSWGSYALRTSIIPFLAALSGRVKVDWKGIGFWRLFGGTVLFAALLYGHPYFTGIALMQVGQ